MKTTEEMIEVMKAYQNGKEIEVRLPNGHWVEATEPTWNWGNADYRVKEEPKYRPYNNIEELFKDWAEKTHSIPATMEKYVRPLIWVKNKYDGNYYERLITLYYSNGKIKIGKQIFSLEDFFYHFTFLDGSPCGIEE